ncbi:MAG: dUTP pyrophosphatase [Candidatus Parcubacteria bacterium]|jgi:dUTP pyrophosphatase|nr:dUTP pyrophosphatase [Candidatus Parcubacteria bacterium]
MKVPIKRMDADLPLPEYKTAGASAMDLCVRETATVAPKSITVFPLNVAIQPPPGHFVLMAARSSLQKRGLMLANGIGILDEDYAGDKDEYHAALYNFTDAPVEVKRGERVTQIVVLPYDRVTWKEEASLGSPDRGAYGTTGL